MPSSSFSVYCFVATGIQDYIMSRTSLREMVGASAIISLISNIGEGSDIQKLLCELGIENVVFGRHGGGGFTLAIQGEESSEQAKLIASYWPLVVEQRAPGLSLVQAVGTATTMDEAWRAATASLATHKRRPPSCLPLATLAVKRAARTGLPLCVRNGRELTLDHVALCKRDAAVNSNDAITTDAVASTLINKYSSDFKDWIWPRDLDAEPNLDNGPTGDNIFFPFRKDANGAPQRDLAVLHFDGNGFGVLADALKKESGEDSTILDAEKALSKLIEDICMGAMHAALLAVQNEVDPTTKVVPIRPLILAGEDITLIARADLALPFAVALTSEFEKLGKDKSLTISGGIAFCKAGFPFERAYKHAELALCDAAKRAARRAGIGGMGKGVPSTICFGPVGAEPIHTGVNPTDVAGLRSPLVYGSGSGTEAPVAGPSLQALLSLADFVRARPELGAALRKLYSVCDSESQPDLAKNEYRRLLKNLEAREPDIGCSGWNDALAKLAPNACCSVSGDLPALLHSRKDGEASLPDFSPLFDLVQWLSVSAVGGEPDSKTKGEVTT